MSSTLPDRLEANPDPREDAPPSLAWDLLTSLASLRLTVVLFILSLILVFVGTLAQMNSGVWTVVAQYFRSILVWVPLQLFVRFGQIFLAFPAEWRLPDAVAFPFPGGWTLGFLLLVNLIAAHLVRFQLSLKRAGILLLHAGLIALLIGELVTGLFAVESRMTIAEGETVNFADESREVELAFTRPLDDRTDEVVVVPGRWLRQGGLVTHPELPVDLEVVEYLANSDLGPAQNGNPRGVQTALSGIPFTVLARGETAGVDTEQREDAVTARIRCFRKGTREEVGAYTVSLWFYPNFTMRIPRYRFAPQALTVDGKTYDLELRPRRDFKPYSLHLYDFIHDTYIGTDTPKDYSSFIRLQDPERSEDREVRISMNAPLRYRGEAYYQSGFLPREARVPGTVLQVVRNPGWLLPYVSCALVTLGMLFHFGLHLFGFLRRRAAS